MAKLAVEVDGIVHGMGDQAVHDERRDAWLRKQGIEVLRIPASAVMADPDEEADHIYRTASARLSRPG
jgi:very-short-patch-repair endonuclease